MSGTRPVYLGPRLKRFRRDLGLTQAQMAADLEISASYVALLERNQRPLTADLLLRLARTYRMDLGDVAGDEAEQDQRLKAIARDPIFADIDLGAMELADVAANFPGVAEALLRATTAYREGQLALADRRADPGAGMGDDHDPVSEVRGFLSARRNCFPLLDDLAERLPEQGGPEALARHFRDRHRLRVRYLPPDVMMGLRRRLDRHREEIWIADTLDGPSRCFQLALQLAWLEWEQPIAHLVSEGSFATEDGRRLATHALARYAAAAWMMPYAAFARAADMRGYDVEALARQFGASFEQAAHRLTTLQKPGQERVPFFFIRVDQAGNVSKRLDGAGFPFARHGGGCPLWSLHLLFGKPRATVTQWLELPDGQRFFSIARTVTAGGGSFGEPVIERAVALGCAAEHASRLVYARSNPDPGPDGGTPIGVSCRLCQRAQCAARSAPPIGRRINREEYRGVRQPFDLSED